MCYIFYFRTVQMVQDRGFCRHRQQQWRSPWFQNVSYSLCRYVVNTQWVHDLNWIKVIVQWPGQHELVIYFRFRSFLHRDFQLFDFIKALKGYNCPWHCFEKKTFQTYHTVISELTIPTMWNCLKPKEIKITWESCIILILGFKIIFRFKYIERILNE